MRTQMSSEAKTTGYYTRMIKRFIKLAICLFGLFLVISFIVWAVPKIWYWAVG